MRWILTYHHNSDHKKRSLCKAGPCRAKNNSFWITGAMDLVILANQYTFDDHIMTQPHFTHRIMFHNSKSTVSNAYIAYIKCVYNTTF